MLSMAIRGRHHTRVLSVPPNEGGLWICLFRVHRYFGAPRSPRTSTLDRRPAIPYSASGAPQRHLPHGEDMLAGHETVIANLRFAKGARGSNRKAP